jgi:hypothetical protein
MTYHYHEIRCPRCGIEVYQEGCSLDSCSTSRSFTSDPGDDHIARGYCNECRREFYYDAGRQARGRGTPHCPVKEPSNDPRN